MAGVQGMGSPNKVPKEVQQPVPPQPVDIPQPEPVQAQKPSLDEIFGAQSQQARPSLDEIFNSGAVQPQVEEFTTEQPSFTDRFGDPSTIAQFLTNPGAGIASAMQTGLGELPARAKAALQVTDKEIKASLESSFGKENVRTRDGDTEYRGKDGKWRIWDAGTTIEDFTVDLLRPAIEEIPASIATAVTAVPATAEAVATGGLAAPLSVGQVAAARAAGAAGGVALADWLQSLTGVPRDEDRSRLLEYGASAIMAPIAGGIGDWATKKLAQKAAQKAATKLLPPAELYKTEIQGIGEAIDQVKKLGGLENIPGTDTPLMLSQLNPSNPVARDMAQQVSKLNGFNQIQEQIAQGFEDSSKSFLKTLGNIDPEKTATGQEVKNFVKSAIKQEGEAIGALRDIVKTEAGNAEVPIPKLKSGVENYAKELGFKIGEQNNLSGIKNYLVDEAGYSKQAAEVLVNKTNKLLERVTNKEGRMTAPELLGAYEELNGLYRNVASGGSDTSPLFRQKVGEIRRLVADELSDKVAVIGGEGAGNKYAASLKRYKELVEAGDEFANLLDKENLATHSLSKAIFSKGVGGLDTAQAAKVLLKDRPDLLNDVKGSYLQNLMADSFNEVTQKTDWTKFYKKAMNPENKEVFNLMFGPEARESMKAYQIVGEAIQKGSVGASGSAARASFLKNLSGIRSIAEVGAAGAELLSQADPGAQLAEMVSKEGIDNFLKTAPKDSKPFLKRVLSQVVNLAYKSASVAPIPLRRLPKEASKNMANESNE